MKTGVLQRFRKSDLGKSFFRISIAMRVLTFSGVEEFVDNWIRDQPFNGGRGDQRPTD